MEDLAGNYTCWGQLGAVYAPNKRLFIVCFAALSSSL